MSARRGRVILAGYPPELPDLVSVRALDRALASGLTLAPPDLPRDFGNRATVWVDTDLTIQSVAGLWDQVTETLGNGHNVLRWFPDNPLSTRSGQQDAHDLRDAGIPIELVPVVPPDVIDATFAGELNWVESLPLYGRRILVTRTLSQAPVLSRALRELGAEPVEMPAIDIIPNPYPEQTRQAADNLPNYDWIIFTSTNTVDVFIETVREAGYDARHFRNVRIAAIGPATGERLRRHFIEPDFTPDEYVAEAALDGLRERGVDGCRILFPRAETARDILPDGLIESGATVDIVPVYRTVPGTPDPLVIEQIDAGKIDTITFTSSSTVTNLIAMLDGDASRLNNTEIACISPITAETARQHGLTVTITATEYTIPGLIDALCSAREDSHA